MVSVLLHISAGLRVATVALACSACAVLVQSRTPPDAGPSAAIARIAEPETRADPARDDARAWFVSADGWQLQIDRATVDFPSVAESFAARPRTVPEVALSPYDPLIKYYASRKGFDWRLIAAIIDAESRFNPRALSPRGAYGLMQVRAVAARAVGETAFRMPADNIRTGVHYLRKLERYVPEARGRDRLMLLLAAYNVGPGHLADARKLAREHGLDPNRWYGGVREVLPALENPAVHTKLRHGYARGGDVVAYVEGVWRRFLEYQRATAAGVFPGPDPRSSGARLAPDTSTTQG